MKKTYLKSSLMCSAVLIGSLMLLGNPANGMGRGTSGMGAIKVTFHQGGPKKKQSDFFVIERRKKQVIWHNMVRRKRGSLQPLTRKIRGVYELEKKDTGPSAVLSQAKR